MSRFHKLLHIFLFAVLFGLNFAFGSQESPPQWFLPLGNKIRFVIPNTPGFGHQSISINSAIHLRQSGYQGSIEMVYTNVEAFDKIHQMITPFDLERFSIELQSYQDLEVSKEMVRFAFLGGADSEQIAFDTFSRYTIAIQPLAWKLPSLLFRNNGHGVLHRLISYGFSRSLPLHDYSVPSYIESYEEILKDPYISDSMARFLSQWKNQKINNALLYGMESIGDQNQAVAGKKLQIVLELQNELKNNYGKDQALILFLGNPIAPLEIQKTQANLRSKGVDVEWVPFSSLSKLDMDRLENKIYLLDIGPQPIKVFHKLLVESSFPISLFGLNSLALALQYKKSFIPTDMIDIKRLRSFAPGLMANLHFLENYFPQYLAHGINNSPSALKTRRNLDSDLVTYYRNWMALGERHPVFSGISIKTDKLETILSQVDESFNQRNLCRSLLEKWVYKY